MLSERLRWSILAVGALGVAYWVGVLATNGFAPRTCTASSGHLALSACHGVAFVVLLVVALGRRPYRLHLLVPAAGVYGLGMWAALIGSDVCVVR